MQVAVVVSKQEVGDFNALAHVFVHFGLGILQIGTTSFIFSTKKSTLINDSKTAQTKSKQCWKTEEHMWKIKITRVEISKKISLPIILKLLYFTAICEIFIIALS